MTSDYKTSIDGEVANFLRFEALIRACFSDGEKPEFTQNAWFASRKFLTSVSLESGFFCSAVLQFI